MAAPAAPGGWEAQSPEIMDVEHLTQAGVIKTGT